MKARYVEALLSFGKLNLGRNIISGYYILGNQEEATFASNYYHHLGFVVARDSVLCLVGYRVSGGISQFERTLNYKESEAQIIVDFVNKEIGRRK